MVGDLLCAGWDAPELAVGDGVAILDAGAYFVPFSTQFSFPRPAVVAVAAGEARLLRAAEAFDDLVARDVEPRPAAAPTASLRGTPRR
jgi:diaminopimelate decarboxylase